MLNCHIRNGTVKTTAQHEERREEIVSVPVVSFSQSWCECTASASLRADASLRTQLSTQRDIQRLKDTASLIVDSLGQDKEQVQARYDFVRANKNMLSLSDPRFKTARAIRSVGSRRPPLRCALCRPLHIAPFFLSG